ncbi:sexual development activator VeA [Histoplasma ohiense]|uniref:Developmental and secondary metabolism regulator VEA1 n=1 Tax=Ajellomyces capsulatus TaxID=5037 RepID=VEA_AJECA|nr:RecName: Full=Developmental and secondary metabolism regulator VEA1; AltName: Full=Velvet complex subunit 1 [Histoplasma capsulatum]ACB59235.1 VEA1 [Histoplasma capsulatum]
MATKASSILHPPNETEHTMSRITQEGKKLTYNLKVIQQPERARACGAGAKSSADRRPVDPPPVVELRVFESDLNDQHKTDITFSYNANFFLFATLEWARPIAHGRVQTQTPSCPVLTGVPVAGIAYLDRPTQAGYFIFPDLSVRHEGLYRLNFNLYEEMKEPKHADKGGLVPHSQNHMAPLTPSKPRSPHQFLHFRLVVKSVPFTVYSAKKFPGLAESTSLSRIVAEQGCRVRIRRDVRMRRREPKPNKDYGAYDDRRITPDPYPGTPVERPRSASNASMDDPYRYPTGPPQVQPSPDYGYHHPSHQQPSPNLAATPQSHLSFGAAPPQYHAPPPPPTAHPAPPPAYTSPHLGYTHTRQLSAGPEYDPHRQKYTQYPPPSPHSDIYDQSKSSLPMNPSVDHPSYPPMPYEQRMSDPKLYAPPSQLHPTQQYQQPTPPPPPPAAIAPHPPHQRTPTKPSPSTFFPPTPSRLSVEVDSSNEADDAILNAIRTRRGYILDEKSGATKRSRDSSDHDLKPLRNGQRPVVSGDEAAKGEIGETSGGSDDEIMTYRRADGRLVAKQRVSVHSKGKEVNIPRDVDLLPRRPEVCAVAE